MIFSRKSKYHSHSDAELVRLYKDKRNSQILGEIYARYGHLVFGASLKYLKNKQNAEDLTMNLFEKLPEKLLNNEIKTFKSWLYMVTKNECLMLLRKKGIQTNELITDPKSDESDETIVIEKEEQLIALEQTIEELKPEQRDCIKLFYIDGKSYSEITDLLKLDIKKVKSAIQNGKRNLKIKLEGRNEFKSIT